MSAITVTAAITTHFRPRALARALDSVLAQTQAPTEILVVEDGADAATAAVVASRRVSIPIRHLRVAPGRVCPAASRNLAIREAKTTHVAFLDDDDAWTPRKNEMQAAGIGDRVLACSNATRSDGQLYFPEGPDRIIDPQELHRHNPVITSTALVRCADVVAVGGFRERPLLRGVEDFDLWLRLRDRFGAFFYSGTPLALYECSDGIRLSSDPLRGEARLAGVRMNDWFRHPASRGSWVGMVKSLGGVGAAAARLLVRSPSS